ncbi:SGNH/GDSL hydrolase family protein [Microbacterium esteraromaticum]|uniref:SGNH/GDSL hydrolase family protein n=1 Tax=Microbacterium esteraromaticum TaxID=57043 RepID=UPI0019580D48|nr:SGNH/GDSL hydrolase family protein [Microbacterium esteraromaticum]MBM7466952.1 lysophospholipase L1-like esterase [Microbacterium esteraromaticum]
MNSVRSVVVPVVFFVAAAFGIRLGLARQAAIARRRIGKPLGEDALDAERVWRRKLPGDAVRLLMVGDSLAAGLGATKPKETLGGRLARALAKQIGAPVVLRSVAVVGSESSDLAAQLETLTHEDEVDVAVIVVGGNDVTHRISAVDSARHLTEAIIRLHERGARVVVGTCPDLGALRPVPQPLRGLASRLSRRLADVQAEAAERSGAAHVSLRRTVGPLFFDEPEQMFSLDRFHPSALGYRRTADALLPAVVAALGERRRVSVR